MEPTRPTVRDDWTPRKREKSLTYAAGSMFWFIRKKFSGS